MKTYESMASYREDQAQAFFRRHQARIRADFWARKARDHEDGERWLRENGRG